MATNAQIRAAWAMEVSKRKQQGQWQEDPTAVAPTLGTEAAGKANTYADQMKEAEGSFQDSLRQGYDPDNMMLKTADWMEGVKVPIVKDILGAMAPSVRPDSADLARFSTEAWTEARNRAASGMNVKEGEEAKSSRTYFPQPGQGKETRRAQDRMRQTIYQGSRVAGTGKPDHYWSNQQLTDQQWHALPPAQLKAAQLYRGSKAKPGDKANPYVPRNKADFGTVQRDEWYIEPDGQVVQKK
jgi:hypothetical protein